MSCRSRNEINEPGQRGLLKGLDVAYPWNPSEHHAGQAMISMKLEWTAGPRDEIMHGHGRSPGFHDCPWLQAERDGMPSSGRLRGYPAAAAPATASALRPLGEHPCRTDGILSTLLACAMTCRASLLC